jgi:hypothetical protein
VANLEATYPPLPLDDELTTAARQLCLTDGDADPDLPLVLQDRREPDFAMMIFANDAVMVTCEVERTADEIRPWGQGMAERWTSDNAAGGGGPSIMQAAARDATSWDSAQGVVPAGTSIVRVVVNDVAIDAVIGQDLYSVTWPGGVPPTVLVALGSDGREVARIGSAELAEIFDRPCDPAVSLGPCPSTP